MSRETEQARRDRLDPWDRSGETPPDPAGPVEHPKCTMGALIDGVWWWLWGAPPPPFEPEKEEP